MNPKLIFNILKKQFRKEVKDKDLKLLILSIDFDRNILVLTTDKNEKYLVSSNGFEPEQVKILLEPHLDGKELRSVLLSFYYIEKTKDYITLIFRDETEKSINLYENN